MRSVDSRFKELGSGLTSAERLVADVIFENYPASALGSITSLAKRAGVSTPTVARLTQKLGFEKYAHFQEAVRAEVDQKISEPGQRVNPWNPKVPEAHVLNKVTDAVAGNVKQTLDDLNVDEFEEMCLKICDTNRSLRILGGRVTRSLADHLFQYMQVIRPDTFFINTTHENHFFGLLDMKAGDLLFVYDIRRYANANLQLCELARERGAEIILVTDQWMSPISKFATHTLRARIAMPTSRDSMVSLMLLNEVVIAQVHHQLGVLAEDRTDEMEQVFDQLKYFKKGSQGQAG